MSSTLGAGGLRRSVSLARSVASLSAFAVDVGVAHDGEQPCPRIGAVERAEPVERPDEGVLHQILGVMRVSAQRSGNAEQHRQVRADERVERPRRRRRVGVRGVGL